MYFKSLPRSESEFLSLVTQFNNVSSTNRRSEISKRIDYYEDKQIEYTKDILTKTFSKPEKMKLQVEFDNITKNIVDELAVIYKKNPIRKIINGSKKDEEIYEKILKTSKINTVLKQVNAYSKLCKNVIVKVVWRNEQIELDIISSDLYDIVQNINDSTKADAIVYINYIDLDNERQINKFDKEINKDFYSKSNVVYYYWDNYNVFLFTKGLDPKIKLIVNEDNIDNINPYGVIPMLDFRDSYPVKGYWIEGGDDIINTNEIINQKLTELNFLTKQQSFSQAVRKGGNTGDSLIICDPSTIIDIPADDDISKGKDFFYVTPDAKIKELQDNITDKKRKIAINYNLNSDTLIQSAEKESGLAQVMKAIQRNEFITKDRPLYLEYEKQLFDIIRIVYNYHSNQKISETAELIIDFAESEIPMTIQELDAHNITLYQNGLLSKTQWLMQLNQDIQNEDEAKEILKKINEERTEERKTDMINNFVTEEDLNNNDNNKNKESE